MLERFNFRKYDKLDIDLATTDLLGAEMAEIRANVSRQKHQLPVFVHPFFTFYTTYPGVIKNFRGKGRRFPVSIDDLETKMDGDYNTIQHRAKLAEYGIKLSRFFRHTRFNTIAIAEEDAVHINTLKTIRGQGYSGTILFYKTQSGSPSPQVEDLFSYTSLASFFYRAKVKTLIVGGQIGMRTKQGLEIDNPNLLSKGIYSYPVDSRLLSGSDFYSKRIGGSNCVSGFMHQVREASNHYAVANNLQNRFPEVITLSPIIS